MFDALASRIGVDFAHVFGVHDRLLSAQRDHAAHVLVDEVRYLFAARVSVVELLGDVIRLVFGGLCNRRQCIVLNDRTVTQRVAVGVAWDLKSPVDQDALIAIVL